jgi:hypothetical protein
MNEKIRLVLSGYLALSSEDRRKFVEEINRYINATEAGKRQIESDLKTNVLKEQDSMRKAGARMETGPLGGGCPCCGR